MAERPADKEHRPPSLIERKQAAARTRIIDAADALFAERGFDGVSVTDIAERAEVGRTTFFRHFGDKSEVVFAKEQAMSAAIGDAASEPWNRDRPVDSLAGALRALEPLVIRLCEQATADPVAYERHERLLDAHEELRAREARKHQQMATGLAQVLVEHDAPPAIATTAAQLALACYASGRLLATAPGDLARRTRAAFRGTLAMGAASADG
ncbi:DNA-binding transcriptional repressor AcrR [Clavibacter michiganensis]|uniref:DNA-binding transcriptional repressor AcrR n=1 Tax=Clavibacter michiganensis TaxID=28447 RepID=A0A251Y912_9MICO|nr:TetR/AcrR family transcriptional regulator [Clavibacter michiganensis]OUE20757.1 DNA-binding transcriptional repressor AcrR [Clavibacter michiganensis]